MQQSTGEARTERFDMTIGRAERSSLQSATNNNPRLLFLFISFCLPHALIFRALSDWISIAFDVIKTAKYIYLF